MTIELSLRRRATLSRCYAFFWLVLAVSILAGCYFSFPTVAGETLNSVNQIESSMGSNATSGTAITAEKVNFFQIHIFSIVILILCLFAVAFASYLLARTAFIELESAARFIGLADAMCIAGDDFEQLEKAVSLLVPRNRYFPEVSQENLKTFLDLVKSTKG